MINAQKIEKEIDKEYTKGAQLSGWRMLFLHGLLFLQIFIPGFLKYKND